MKHLKNPKGTDLIIHPNGEAIMKPLSKTTDDLFEIPSSLKRKQTNKIYNSTISAYTIRSVSLTKCCAEDNMKAFLGWASALNRSYSRTTSL